VFWKNTFEIEVHGATGSLHLDGLDKWGGARLVHRARVLPSGVPTESVETTAGPDLTWARDVDEFERRVRLGLDSADDDWRIARALTSLALQAPGLDVRERAAS
jgi:hypothetical protein